MKEEQYKSSNLYISNFKNIGIIIKENNIYKINYQVKNRFKILNHNSMKMMKQ